MKYLKITYSVEGLNFNKFIKEAKKRNIIFCELKREDSSHFFITVEYKYKKSILHLFKIFSYNVSEIKLSFMAKFCRFFRQNIAFMLVCLLVCISIFITNNFVFKTEITGNSSITKQEILSILNSNGYQIGKRKTQYKLDLIESVLTSKLDKISYASAIIRGNTLIVNVNEKIDNSDYIYDYEPIFAICDCLIQNIDLLSGTIVCDTNKVVRKGDMIISPYMTYNNSTKLPVPAKGTITAYIEYSTFLECEKSSFLDNKAKFIELNRKKLYNNISNKLKESELEEILEEKEINNKIIFTTTIKGIIKF